MFKNVFKIMAIILVFAFIIIQQYENYLLTAYSLHVEQELNITKIELANCRAYIKQLESQHNLEDNDILEVKHVTVTMYHPVVSQTDSRPNETADGTIIQVNHASVYKYIAVSRDLHVRWGGDLNFGDFVYLDTGNNEKTGVYQVKDIMNKRFDNRVDILESPNVKPYKINNAILTRLEIPDIEGIITE